MPPILLALFFLPGAGTMDVSAAQQAAAPTAEDARLAKLFESYLDQEFRRHPLYATQQGNHEYDDRLDDLSPAARKKDVEIARGMLATLGKEIDVQKLSRNGQIDHEVWTHALKYSLWSVENDNRFEFDPRVYGEYISDSVFLLFTQSSLPRERNVQNAAKRITYIPRIVAAAKEGLKNPAEGAHGDRHQAQPRRDRLLREGGLRLRPGNARRRAAGDAVQAGRQGAQGLSERGSKRNFCPSPTASGGSARRSSPRSWNWNSTRASRPMRS